MSEPLSDAELDGLEALWGVEHAAAAEIRALRAQHKKDTAMVLRLAGERDDARRRGAELEEEIERLTKERDAARSETTRWAEAFELRDRGCAAWKALAKRLREELATAVRLHNEGPDQWASRQLRVGEACGCYPCDTCNGYRAHGEPCATCSVKVQRATPAPGNRFYPPERHPAWHDGPPPELWPGMLVEETCCDLPGCTARSTHLIGPLLLCVCCIDNARGGGQAITRWCQLPYPEEPAE